MKGNYSQGAQGRVLYDVNQKNFMKQRVLSQIPCPNLSLSLALYVKSYTFCWRLSLYSSFLFPCLFQLIVLSQCDRPQPLIERVYVRQKKQVTRGYML